MVNSCLEISRSHDVILSNKRCQHYYSVSQNGLPRSQLQKHKSKSKFCKTNETELEFQNAHGLNNVLFQIKRSHSERSIPLREEKERKLKLKKDLCSQDLLKRKSPSAISIVGSKPPRIYIIDARKNKDAKPISISTNDLKENQENWSRVLMAVLFLFVVILFSFSGDIQYACERTYNRGASFRKYGFKYYFCWMFKLFGKANIFL